MSAATYVHCNTADALARAAAAHPGWPLLVTGVFVCLLEYAWMCAWSQSPVEMLCVLDSCTLRPTMLHAPLRKLPVHTQAAPQQTRPLSSCPPALQMNQTPPGHSLGGGVAALVTLLLQLPGGAPSSLLHVRCVCIGPAAVLSRELADGCKGHVTSVVLGCDPVPRLSMYSVERLLLDLVDSSLSRRAAKSLAETTTGAPWAGFVAAHERQQSVFPPPPFLLSPGPTHQRRALHLIRPPHCKCQQHSGAL